MRNNIPFPFDMTAKSIGIALGSTFCRVGDLDFNLAQIAHFAEQACKAGSHILLTPELSATGYGPYPEVTGLAETAGSGPAYNGLAAIAGRSGVAIAAGFVEKHEHGPGISHYVVFPSGEFIVQRKYRVTPFESPLTSAIANYATGEEVPTKLDFELLRFPTFEIEGLKCAVVICADWGIEGLHEFFDAHDVRMAFVGTGAGGDVKDRVRTCDLATQEGREKYVRSLEKVGMPSAESILVNLVHRRAVAAVNQVGWDGRKCAHIGHGTVVSPLGEVPVFIHGIPNLDLQEPRFAAGRIPLAHFAL